MTADVTVIIPTLNGEKYLDAVLTAIETQVYDGEVEVLVVDSGSTDATLSIVRSHHGVRLHQIKQSEFGHGRTRNLAAQLANGRDLVFLTQNAVPASSGWLDAITRPLDQAGLAAAGVVGKHFARANCSPLLKYEINGVFRSQGPDDTETVFELPTRELSARERERFDFYSDVNSAVRRDFLFNVISYQDLPYSEDVAFAHDLLTAGYRKVYSPEGAVVHSNDVTLREYGKRIFDETIALRRIGHLPAYGNGAIRFLRMAKSIARDSARIVRDPDYGLGSTVKWLVINPAYHVQKLRGINRALSVDLNDTAAIERYSLERERIVGSP